MKLEEISPSQMYIGVLILTVLVLIIPLASEDVTRFSILLVCLVGGGLGVLVGYWAHRRTKARINEIIEKAKKNER